MPKTNSRYRATITMAKYKATCAKLRAAYVAMQELTTGDKIEYRAKEPLWSAMDALRLAPEGLRTHACAKCDHHGYYGKPDDPYTAYGCLHEEVPSYDVRKDHWTL